MSRYLRSRDMRYPPLCALFSTHSEKFCRLPESSVPSSVLSARSCGWHTCSSWHAAVSCCVTPPGCAASTPKKNFPTSGKTIGGMKTIGGETIDSRCPYNFHRNAYGPASVQQHFPRKCYGHMCISGSQNNQLITRDPGI